MYAMILVSMLILVAYLAFAIAKTGWPYSISETYYRLKAAGYKEGLFTLALTGVAMTAIVPLIEATPEKWKFLAFMMCAGIMFVAFAPQFARRLDNWVHYIATGVSGISSMIWCCVAFRYGWIPLVLALGVVIYPIVKNRVKWLFWIEIAVFAAVYVDAVVALAKYL